MMTIEEYKEACLTRPSDFMNWDDDLDFVTWGISSVSVHRDSDLIEQSNWEVISKDLLERFPDSFRKFRANHFLVGWVEYLIVKVTDEEAVKAAYDWMCRLADYPVADDEDLSNREWEEAQDAWDNWASYDVKRLIKKEEISCLLDEDGDYDATDEQEEILKSLVARHVLDYDGIKDDRLVISIQDAFKEVDTETLTFDF